MWLSLVERSVRDREVVGSNPAIPTIGTETAGCATRGPPFSIPGTKDQVLDSLLQLTGYGLCHQLPERSLFGGGVQLPVCARDTGIYIGFIVSLLVISALHRPERPRMFPRPWVWGVIGLLIGVMALDGFTSYAGWRTTSNELRLLTGLAAGFGASALLAPILNDVLWSHPSPNRVLDPLWRAAVWLGALPAAHVVIWFGGPLLGPLYPWLVVVAVLATLTSVNLAIVGMFPAFDRRAVTLRDLASPVAVGLVLAVFEIALAGVFRYGVGLLAAAGGS